MSQTKRVWNQERQQIISGFGVFISTAFKHFGGFPDGTSGKELTCKCRRHKRRGFDLWVGNPLQYFCLENPIDRGAWQATVHRVTKSRTRLK